MVSTLLPHHWYGEPPNLSEKRSAYRVNPARFKSTSKPLQKGFVADATFPCKISVKKEKQQFCALVAFPGRRQPSIVTVNELNYCVRNGNRCTLVTINTYYFVAHSCAALLLYHTISLLSTSFLKKFGDPWENRTPVCGVRGRRLSRLTNGP